VPAGLGLKPVSASNKTYNGFRDRRSVPRIARKHWLRRPLRCPARQPVRQWASKGRASRVLVLWSDSGRPSVRPELRRARVSRRRVPTARGAWCVAESVNALFVEPSPPGDGAANVGEAGQRSPGIPDSTRPYLVRNPGVSDRTFSVGFFGAGVPPGRLYGRHDDCGRRRVGGAAAAGLVNKPPEPSRVRTRTRRGELRAP
jgi:hypothetical protein